MITPEDGLFEQLIKNFGPHPGVRSIIVVECDRIADSCGYAVPFMSFEEDRRLLDEWAQRKDIQQKHAYRAKHNRESIDGLPGLEDH